MSDAEPTESEPALNGMEAVRDVLNEVGSQAIGSTGDALHVFLATTQAIESLGAGSVQATLYEEFDWYRAIWDGEATLLEGASESDEAMAKWTDRLADFGKRSGNLISQWLRAKDIAVVKLWAYMTCHQQFVQTIWRQTGIEEEAGSAAA